MALLKTHTLGCKVNQYETELVREGFLRANFTDAAEDEAADVCVVNTCTVTHEGDAKSRQVIRRLARENPNSKLIVMGCYATRAPEEVAALPGVTEVITDKRELPDLLQRFGVVDLPTGISRFGTRKRAYVKVQDGCLLRCSYCIIPYVRPHLFSRPPEHIVEEIARLRDNGYREIVLTGVHLGHYGVEGNFNKPKENWLRLSHLLRKLVALPGDFRLRLSSIEATEVTRELIDVIGEHPDRICPHLHLCLQSGSDAILRRMRRRWGQQTFLNRCQLLRDKLDQPAITTDIIVGFPGETEFDFMESCRTAEEAGFSKIHIFPFSSRKGTPAAEMGEQVDPHVKADRVQRLEALEVSLRERYHKTLIGKRLRVMTEGVNERGRWQGTSCRYAQVEFVGETQLARLVDVVPTALANGMLSTDVVA